MSGGISEDRLIDEVSVRHFDVVVVGGGIAGVAIVERLAREARRRDNPLRIALVERAPQLGKGSSGRLEGWFHTGALYSALADGETFMTCVKTVERLINWYRLDPSFSCQNCNFALGIDWDPRSGNQHNVPMAVSPAGDSPWFLPNAPVHYALRRNLEGNASQADEEQWKQQSERISSRIRTAYWEWEWLERGLAVAPPASEALKPPERSTRSENEDREAPWQGSGDLHESDQEEIRDMLWRYESKGAGRDRLPYRIYRSRDSVMDTRRILRDLASSAVSHGVEFILDTEIRDFNVPAYGDITVTGLVGSQTLRDGNGSGTRILHLLARQYVFALGSGFSDKFLRDDLGLRLRMETHRSVMAVIHPPLVPHNFVRMDYYHRNHFNHILRSLGMDSNEGGVLEYSMIANSAFDAHPTSAVKKIAQSIEGLLQTACKYFPETFYHDKEGDRRNIQWYQCNKTEFFSDDERKRNYSYWCEPQLGEAVTAFEESDPELKSLGGSPRSLSGVLNKLVHAILRLQVNSKIEPGPREEAVKALYAQMDSFIDQVAERSGRHPNFLCVLPGKFSFFPLLAHKVYLEMESRGLFRKTVLTQELPRGTEPEVARPHPVELLQATRPPLADRPS